MTDLFYFIFYIQWRRALIVSFGTQHGCPTCTAL